jgi:hypothetical protein
MDESILFSLYIRDIEHSMTHHLFVHPTDTIHVIKAMIEDQSHIPIEDQRLFALFIPGTNRELELDDSLPISIFPQLNGSSLNLLTRFTQIEIRRPGKSGFQLTISCYDQISDIKAQIEEKHNIHRTAQQLIYKGMILSDKKQIPLYEIREHSVLWLVIPAALRARHRMLIVLDDCHWNSWSIVEVDPDETIGEFRRKCGIERLEFDNQILLDNKTFREQAVKELGIVRPEPKEGFVRIIVKPNSIEAKMVYVDGKETVFGLMKVIERIIGMKVDEQRLIFAGRQVEREYNLRACNLDDGVTVHLVQRLKG